ncbi:MAG: hypothetical protein M1832_003887 [Thelocarpon impressellum]|nr:MAG: hypothetical protein M1832_003887 [Thelocarpon impressellum]
MATSASPRRKKRDAQYFDLGVQGRKTGVTLRERARDELGLEAVSGIFSSPAKASPVKTLSRPNGVRDAQRSPSPGSDDRRLQSRPQVLSQSRRANDGRPSIPLPRARSPIKTNLNSPARRQPSLAASPTSVPPTVHSPITIPTVNRRLNFSLESPINSVRRRPEQPSLVKTASPARPAGGVFAKNAQTSPERVKKRGLMQRFKAEPSDGDYSAEIDAFMAEEDDEDGINGVDLGGESDNADESMQMVDEAMTSVLPAQDETTSTVVREETPDVSREAEEQLMRSAEASLAELRDHGELGSSPVRSVKAKGRAESPRESAEDAVPPQATVAAKKQGRGLPPKPKAARREARESNLGQRGDEPEASQPKGKGKRGREDSEEPRPKKKGRTAGVVSEESESQPRAKVQTKARKKPPPSQRDPNAKITSVTKLKRSRVAEVEAEVEAETTTQDERPKKRRGRIPLAEEGAFLREMAQRSNWEARKEAPEKDPRGAQKTRSGRTAVKPMEYWRNERAVYTEGNSLVEIVRTEEVQLPRRKPGRTKGTKTKTQRATVAEDEQPEEWEEEPGIISARVEQWDGDAGSGGEQDSIETEIAYASGAIEPREVANTSFRFAKTLTLPFFGAGMVELPPGGSKRPKNSRRMQMVFFVHSGKVRVTVANTSFSICRGGMWQVPRGNAYSIANDTDAPARVFFSQGCELEQGDAESQE